MKIVVFCLTLILTASAVLGQLSDNVGQERIKGGTNAEEGEFPYLVSIAVDGNHTCAGFLYNDEWVVTTASCVDSFNSSLFNTKVVVGQLSLITDDEYEKAYSIYTIIKFDGYNSDTKLHDLALIQTESKITFSEGVYCEFYEEADSRPDEGLIMGWGATFQGATIPSTRLKKGTITNLANTNCNATYKGFDRNYMICAGTANEPVAPCRFDEGGPLVQTTFDGKQYIIGIFSQTAGCESGQPAVFTRLAPYYAWFEKYAKKQPIDVCGTFTTPAP